MGEAGDRRRSYRIVIVGAASAGSGYELPPEWIGFACLDDPSVACPWPEGTDSGASRYGGGDRSQAKT
jgi:hypothetical protein